MKKNVHEEKRQNFERIFQALVPNPPRPVPINSEISPRGTRADTRARVLHIPLKCVKFYGHKVLCIIYQIRKHSGKITGLLYNKIYPTTYPFRG